MSITQILNKINDFFTFKDAETYYIEFRIQGGLKKFSRKVQQDLAKKFGAIGTTNRRKFIPHLTILIPFKTKHPELMLEKVSQTLRKYKPLEIRASGYNVFDNPKGKVIYIDFETPQEMLNLRNDLARVLNQALPDLKEKFHIRETPDFHLTLGYKEIDAKVPKMMRHLTKHHPQPRGRLTLDRVSIINRNKIFREIDLRNKKVLTRKQALGFR